jgi:hypothetical protein
VVSTPRLFGVVIDAPRAEYDRAVAFWAAAIGREPFVNETYPHYSQFADATPGCYLLVQATGDDNSRVHLDFVTEDRDADVARAVGLGATEIDRDHPWAVLRDPAGLPFCLCPVTGCT